MSVQVTAAPQIPWEVFALGSSGTVTDATVTSDTYLNVYYKGCVLVVNRTAESGTCTLDVKLQGYDKPSDTYFDVPAATLVQYADGETGVRTLLVYPGATGSDADGVLVATSNKAVNGFLPYQFRVSVVHGGTSVANTFSVTLYPLV